VTGDLVVVEWTDPGGGTDPPTYIAPLHVHHHDDEEWHVLEGAPARYRLTMTPRIKALIDALHAPGAGDTEAIFRAHDSPLIGWP
jgi:hypothetical protein